MAIRSTDFDSMVFLLELWWRVVPLESVTQTAWARSLFSPRALHIMGGDHITQKPGPRAVPGGGALAPNPNPSDPAADRAMR
jgi:hypothetical protein